VDEPLDDDRNTSIDERARDTVGRFAAVHDDSADCGHGR
jgi:hypothetical protein